MNAILDAFCIANDIESVHSALRFIQCDIDTCFPKLFGIKDPVIVKTIKLGCLSLAIRHTPAESAAPALSPPIPMRDISMPKPSALSYVQHMAA